MTATATALSQLTKSERRAYDLAKANGPVTPGCEQGVIMYGLSSRTAEGHGAFLPAKGLSKIVALGLGERLDGGWVRPL